MQASTPVPLSRRERQIMDIVYRRGRVTTAEVLEELDDPPTYNAVRSALRLLEEKGHLKHEEEARRYVYLATTPRTRARSHALQHLVKTFFGGSAEQVVNALLAETELSPAELERMARRIEEAKRAEEEQ
ncbi:BlaI/MecI/CopY family transcriptional regulator [Longimicrobium sp.]|jgi:predicted transcriptional regulator|uniref:BlaI/MecI/CopY family transcriptional regulator n=1 Tax=Longimicrobium sp. TaxID=2029185 RepID=UPI002EDA6992